MHQISRELNWPEQSATRIFTSRFLDSWTFLRVSFLHKDRYTYYFQEICLKNLMFLLSNVDIPSFRYLFLLFSIVSSYGDVILSWNILWYHTSNDFIIFGKCSWEIPLKNILKEKVLNLKASQITFSCYISGIDVIAKTDLISMYPFLAELVFTFFNEFKNC